MLALLLALLSLPPAPACAPPRPRVCWGGTTWVCMRRGACPSPAALRPTTVPGSSCTTGDACPPAWNCTQGRCTPPPRRCRGDVHCPTGRCEAGRCVPPAPPPWPGRLLGCPSGNCDGRAGR